MWDWSYWPMPHFFFDALFMIVFLVCMIMMMWVMRGHRYGGSYALDILNERYARGEIIKPNTKSDGATIELGADWSGQGRLVLLLPALSSISTRRE